MDPVDFLELAKEMVSWGTCQHIEAKMRTVVGRAYYSAFLTTRSKLSTISPEVRSHLLGTVTAEIHKVVIDELKKNPKLITIGDQLGALRDYRNDADYRPLEQRDWNSLANYSTSLARHIIDRLIAFFKQIRKLKYHTYKCERAFLALEQEKTDLI